MPLDLLNWLITPEALAAALVLVFLAGLSEGVGTRGVVLLVSRTTPSRFALGLIASALLFVISAGLWVAGLWLVFEAIYGVRIAPRAFFVTLSVAYVPLLLGALRLLPLLGPLIGALLRIWSFGVALASIAAVTELGLLNALVGALLGTLLVEGARWLLSEPAESLGRQVLYALSGRRRLLERTDLPLVIPGYDPAEVQR